MRKLNIFKDGDGNAADAIASGTAAGNKAANDLAQLEKAGKKSAGAMIVIQEDDESWSFDGEVPMPLGSRRRKSLYRPDERQYSTNGNNNNNNNGSSNGSGKAHVQVQKLIKYILEKTESSSVDEFLDRFQQSKKMVDMLNNQQMLLDSRLSQLRSEHQELSTMRSDMSFVGEEPLKDLEDGLLAEERRDPPSPKTPANAEEFMSPTSRMRQKQQSRPQDLSTTSGSVDDLSIGGDSQSLSQADEESDERYVDSKLFVKEVRLRQLQLLNKNAVYVINEVRTAVAHVMHLIVLNEKLLSALPKVSPPPLKEDSDLTTCLSW